jgi:hypothetical protein
VDHVEPHYREYRRLKAHGTMAARHPIATLYGWTMVRVGGIVVGLLILAHWVGIW